MNLEFDIAVGKSRHETRWKNERWTWKRLADKLRKTTRTAETAVEYSKATKQRKGEIKDVGGFVGGYVNGGRRKSGAVLHRQLITLDIDYGKSTVWEDITTLYDCSALLYSTHSHTPKNPRYRLIIPLNREVDCEEYEAIARRVAANVGIDLFDDSTYQPERLMYWASTSRDGEYVFEEQEGEPLDADEVLATYRNWRDSSQWEVSSRIEGIIRKAMTKQGEPTEKPGAVGRFCRAYSISEAIDEYLSDIYESTASDDRYTYIAGSTAGGLVTYDDKFAYSHHGTDPAGQKLCNAFDLVRIHLYGLKDEDAREGTTINHMPSYLAMEELVAKDTKVKQMLAAEARQRLEDDFGGIDITGENDSQEENNDWMEELETNKKGDFLSTARNITTILENAKGLKGNIRRNELIHADVITRDLPWRSVLTGTGERWCDEDDNNLIVYMEMVYGITGKDKILTVKSTVAAKHWYQPVRDYLKSLSWDGIKRADRLFIDCLGAEDTKLMKTVTRKALTAAVARAFEPGCKFDYITVLQGAEGIGKSTLLQFLGGVWFTDCVTDLSGKEGREQIQGYWIEELGELVGVKRGDTESIKAFLSCQTDSYRPAYGRVRQEFKRQCVFFATTNEGEFLKGDTGNRRFWIVPCINKATLSPWDLTDEYRNQVWAEATHYYRKGEDLYLPKDLEEEMRQKQRAASETENDARRGMIEEYLQKRLPVDWAARDINSRIVYLADDNALEKDGTHDRDSVCALEIWCEVFHGRIDDDKVRYKTKEINKLLEGMSGWEKSSKVLRFPIYGVQRAFTKTKENEGVTDDENL